MSCLLFLTADAAAAALAESPDGELQYPTEMDSSLEEVLDEGVRRLDGKTTWKVWQWPADQMEFYDAESFRLHVTVSGCIGRFWSGY